MRITELRLFRFPPQWQPEVPDRLKGKDGICPVVTYAFKLEGPDSKPRCDGTYAIVKLYWERNSSLVPPDCKGDQMTWGLCAKDGVQGAVNEAHKTPLTSNCEFYTGNRYSLTVLYIAIEENLTWIRTASYRTMDLQSSTVKHGIALQQSGKMDPILSASLHSLNS